MGIHDNLIREIQFSLTDKWVEIVIDGYINLKFKMKTGIPQGSPVSPIFFPIYISGVFLEIEKELPNITCPSFIDDLGFLVAGNSMLEINRSLERVGKISVDWGRRNAVTYDISKIKVILFSKARNRNLVKQLTDTKLKIGGQTICFTQNATRWLNMWLNSHLNFNDHVSERLGEAKIENSRIKKLSKTY